MNRVLITGGAGAIGSNVAQTLIDQGSEVIILDDLSAGHVRLIPKQATFIKGSVEAPQALEAAFAKPLDFVVHMAALFANQNSVEHPEHDLMVNGMGTLRVLLQAVKHQVKKVVYTSSSCVYGPKEVMRESDPDLRPDTPYAITKLLGEKYSHFVAEQHGLPMVMVRLFNNYGPGEFPGKYRNVIPNFFALAMNNEPLPITGTGEETRDFNFVSDTVSGILGALFSDSSSGEIFNIGSGRETSIRELAEKINRISGSKAGFESRPARSWDHVRQRRGDVEKAQLAFGYRPQVSLEEGLELTYRWLRDNA